MAVGPTVTPFNRQARFKRALSSFCDDIDYSANRLRTVERSTGAAKNFNALDILGCEMGKIKGSKRCAIDFDAVEENQNMVRLGAANEYRRIGATRT